MFIIVKDQPLKIEFNITAQYYRVTMFAHIILPDQIELNKYYPEIVINDLPSDLKEINQLSDMNANPGNIYGGN